MQSALLGWRSIVADVTEARKRQRENIERVPRERAVPTGLNTGEQPHEEDVSQMSGNSQMRKNAGRTGPDMSESRALASPGQPAYQQAVGGA